MKFTKMFHQKTMSTLRNMFRKEKQFVMKTPIAFSKIMFKLFFLSTFCIVMNEKVNGQRDGVDRTTGKKIHPCQDVNFCGADSDDEDEYYGMPEYCLKCWFHKADSTMSSEYNKLIETLPNQKMKNSLSIKQKKWTEQAFKKAHKESEEYQNGGERTEYLRVMLLQTKERIVYLKKYKS
jgi:uncharacterized protein YecT (DUF1311 family)